MESFKKSQEAEIMEISKRAMRKRASDIKSNFNGFYSKNFNSEPAPFTPSQLVDIFDYRPEPDWSMEFLLQELGDKIEYRHLGQGAYEIRLRDDFALKKKPKK